MKFGPYPGVVEKVHDGDTVYCALDVGFDLTVHTKVRVFGINAPELSTAEGKAARDFAQGLLAAGDTVEVVSHGWDKFGGRIDGDVWIVVGTDEEDFATAMIAAGHAKPWDGHGAKP